MVSRQLIAAGPLCGTLLQMTGLDLGVLSAVTSWERTTNSQCLPDGGCYVGWDLAQQHFSEYG